MFTKKMIKVLLTFIFCGIGSASVHSSSTLTMCDKVGGIVDEQRERFGMVSTACVAGTPALGAHAFVLGCRSCAGAEYDASTNLLVNTSQLKKIPTTYLLRVPENWNGRVIVAIPPGTANHTFLFPPMVTLLNEGYAMATMDHPEPGVPASPGFLGFPYEEFIGPPYRTKDYRNAYLSTGHLLKELMTEVFGEPVGTYAFGISRGALMGTEFLGDENGTPFDGYLIGPGGDGLLNQLMTIADSFINNRIYLTNLPPLEVTAADRVETLAGVPNIGIGTADPEYKAYILNGTTDDERLARALAYNAAERPKDVQKAWADLEFGHDIQRPTIFVKGLRDRISYPGLALSYADGVVAAEKSDLLRLYLVRNITHGGMLDPPAPPPVLWVDAVHKLDAWIQNGTEPGSINVGAFGRQPSCTTLGFGTDPLGCFCNIMGGVDFGGLAIPECD